MPAAQLAPAAAFGGVAFSAEKVYAAGRNAADFSGGGGGSWRLVAGDAHAQVAIVPDGESIYLVAPTPSDGLNRCQPCAFAGLTIDGARAAHDIAE